MKEQELPLLPPAAKPGATLEHPLTSYVAMHGVRLEVYSAIQGTWFLLTPTEPRDRTGSGGLYRVIQRYRTFIRSLRRRSYRVRRYQLTAVRLVVAPPRGPAYVFEAFGEAGALNTLSEPTEGTLRTFTATGPTAVYPEREPRKLPELAWPKKES